MNKKIDLAQMINDPFKGKSGFMPEKIEDEILVRAGLNENLAIPEELMKDLMKKVVMKIDPRIYPEDYCDSLCEVIAREYHLKPNQVVVGNGGDKIIDLMVRLTITSGYSAVILNPTYPMFEHAVKVQGGNIAELLLTPEPDFDLDVDYILSEITPTKDRLLFLCNPNNPTGNIFAEDKIRKLVSEFPGIVALDETYSDFSNFSMVKSLKDYPNLIIIKSLAKSLGLAGMRIGFALADEFLINRIKELHPAFNVNSATIELTKLVMQEKEVLQKVMKNILSERDLVFSELRKINDIIPYKSFTNFILFKVKNKDAKAVQKTLLKEHGVLVRNMSAMPLCQNCLRVTITTKQNNQEFLKALKEVMSLT